MSSSEAVAFSFTQLDRPADSAPIADVLSAAWAEAEGVRAQARAEGEAAGRAEGLAAAREEAVPALEALADAVRAFEWLRDDLVASLESQAAELALRLAEQIVGAAIEVAPARVVEVTRGALRRLADRHRVTVIVNPSDLELLSDAVAGLQAELGGIEHIDVQSDRRIERGGAIVRTETGEIDVTLAAQMQTARDVVMAALHGGQDGDADPVDDAG